MAAMDLHEQEYAIRMKESHILATAQHPHDSWRRRRTSFITLQ